MSDHYNEASTQTGSEVDIHRDKGGSEGINARGTRWKGTIPELNTSHSY